MKGGTPSLEQPHSSINVAPTLFSFPNVGEKNSRKQGLQMPAFDPNRKMIRDDLQH